MTAWVMGGIGMVAVVLAIWHPFSSGRGVVEEDPAPFVNGRGIPEGRVAHLSVSIGGAVYRPGLYQLPVGSRVVDLLQLAGGHLAGANTTKVKLAAYLKDGDHVAIPHTKISPKPARRAKRSVDHSPDSPNIELDPLVMSWLNRYSVPDLIKQLRLGREDAMLIQQYRLRNGIRSRHDLIKAGVSSKVIRQLLERRQRSIE